VSDVPLAVGERVSFTKTVGESDIYRATKTWRASLFTGVLNSNDVGGARMGEDPASSVVNPELSVHDTPRPFVVSGAVFPTCPGINPTLTMWILCYRIAERLVERLRCGEEERQCVRVPLCEAMLQKTRTAPEQRHLRLNCSGYCKGSSKRGDERKVNPYV